MASANLQQTVVKLNVGGTRFETSLSTLARYPESMFTTWFANWNVELQDEYFVDFDGALFKHVLEFLRFGEAAILPKDEQSVARLLQAADYFQLPRLHATIELQVAKTKPTSQRQHITHVIVSSTDYSLEIRFNDEVIPSLANAFANDARLEGSSGRYYLAYSSGSYPSTHLTINEVLDFLAANGCRIVSTAGTQSTWIWTLVKEN